MNGSITFDISVAKILKGSSTHVNEECIKKFLQELGVPYWEKMRLANNLNHNGLFRLSSDEKTVTFRVGLNLDPANDMVPTAKAEWNNVAFENVRLNCLVFIDPHTPGVKIQAGWWHVEDCHSVVIANAPVDNGMRRKIRIDAETIHSAGQLLLEVLSGSIIMGENPKNDDHIKTEAWNV